MWGCERWVAESVAISNALINNIAVVWYICIRRCGMRRDKVAVYGVLVIRVDCVVCVDVFGVLISEEESTDVECEREC